MKACPDAYHCPVEATIDIVGGKHKVLILWHLSKHGVLRFGELQRLMTQATPKMLTQQLRELEADGMVHRELYHQVPPKTEYSLTPRAPFHPRPERHVRLGQGRARRRYRRLKGVRVAGMPPSMMSFGSPSMSGWKYATASGAMPW